MGAHSYEELKTHIGHKIEVVTYGDPQNPDNIAVECEDCSTVLLDFDRPDNTDLQRLLGLANEGGPEASIALDDLVHDTASNPASEINNQGAEAQIRYLLDAGVEAKQIEDELKEAMKH